MHRRQSYRSRYSATCGKLPSCSHRKAITGLMAVYFRTFMTSFMTLSIVFRISVQMDDNASVENSDKIFKFKTKNESKESIKDTDPEIFERGGCWPHP